ncbi:MAG: beta-propeller domain-containing protein, partial [Vallitaleaceae bacterium]|nr:beta-propeller domain-containing protein [Vallitaleaceae bacterium]
MKIGIKNVLIMGLILILSVGIGGTTFTRLKANSGSDDGSRITIYIDQIETDVVEAPFLMNDRTMIPLRGLFESLGATVDYNEITKQAIIKTNEREILLGIGNQFVLVNGQLESLDAASQLKNNRTYIPLRFVAEALGYQVDWDAQNRSVLINTKNPEVLKQEDLPLVGDKEHLKQLIGYSQNLSSYMNQSWRVTGDMVFEVTTDKAEESTTSSEEIADLAPEATNEESSQSAGDGAGSDNTSTEHSETNNQTEGVEEGDIIKTDGKYIYHLNQNQVNIFSVDPNQPSLVSTLRLEDQNRQITDIYLEGNTLVLIGSSYNYSYYPTETYETTETLKPEEVAVEDVVFPEAVADEMYIMPYYGSSKVFVTTYDISNIDQPVLAKNHAFEGTYVSSRLIGTKLYLITNQNINNWVEEPMLPYYEDLVKGEKIEIGYDSIRYFPEYVAPNYLTTVGMDILSDQMTVNTYLGYAEGVYGSSEHLYLTFAKYEYANQTGAERFMPYYEVNTSIYKFAYDDGALSYIADGQVEGTILNQFSMDEFQGNLRIATTTGEMWNSANISKNNVFILDENLEALGAVTGLAEGERIYSTRFYQERIYMVTFKQVDPLFVIDATNPRNPMVLGYLKIPGFSTYMHLLDKNHILGFGSDTIEMDGWTTTGGMKISLFDVTDPKNPIEKKNQVIGTAGTYSELQYNHKALMISLSKGIMAFPIRVAEVPYVQAFSGAYVYQITNDDF